MKDDDERVLADQTQPPRRLCAECLVLKAYLVGQLPRDVPPPPRPEAAANG